MRSTLFRVVGLMCVFILVGAKASAQPSADEVTARAFSSELLERSQRAITRDNAISLSVTDVGLASLENSGGKYAVVVDADLVARAGGTPKSFSIVMQKPVEVQAGSSGILRIASAYRTIFSNEGLNDVREIALRVSLIRLDDEQRKTFSGVAALFGTVVNKSMFGPLLQILGVDDGQAIEPKVVTFEGHFEVPQNFWAHSKAEDNGFPVLVNDTPIGLVYQAELPKNNTSLVTFLKNTANRVSRLVSDRAVVKSADRVQGFVTFAFTKGQFDPLPKGMTNLLRGIHDGLAGTVVSRQIEQHLNNMDYMLDALAQDVPRVTQNSVYVFADLAKIYAKLRRYRTASEGSAERDEITLLFRDWLDSSPQRLSQEPSKGPKISGRYPPRDGGSSRYPIIVFPYALTDEFIVASVAWQMKLHDFIAGINPLPKGSAIDDFVFYAPGPIQKDLR